MVNYSISLLAIASCIALSSTTTAVNAATHQLRAQQQKQYDPTLHSQTTTQRILSSPYYRYGGNDATNNGSDGRKKCTPNLPPMEPIERWSAVWDTSSKLMHSTGEWSSSSSSSSGKSGKSGSSVDSKSGKRGFRKLYRHHDHQVGDASYNKWTSNGWEKSDWKSKSSTTSSSSSSSSSSKSGKSGGGKSGKSGAHWARSSSHQKRDVWGSTEWVRSSPTDNPPPMMESMLQQVQTPSDFTSLMLGDFLNTEDSNEDSLIMDMINPMSNDIENTVPDMMELLKPDLHPTDCPQGDTVTSGDDGTVRVEGSTFSVGTTHCSDDPLLGQTESFIGVLKTSFYCIEKDGKVIEQGGTTSTSGDFTYADGTKVVGISSSTGSTSIDHETGVVTFKGEAGFAGSIVTGAGVLLFSGDTATGSTTKVDCSDNQCKNGGMGQDLGVPDSFTSFNGQSVSPLGTFFGSTSTSGNRTIDENDIVTIAGTAGFHGILFNEFGSTEGSGLSSGFLKLGLDDSYVGDVSGGFAQFEGKSTSPLFEFEGSSRSEGLTTVTSDRIILKGNANSFGKLTAGSFSSDGHASAEGFLELDRNSLALVKGGGSTKFVGTSKDEATGFEFTGNSSSEGSITLGEDGYFLEGTAQANGEIVSGSVTISFELFDQLVAGLPSF